LPQTLHEYASLRHFSKAFLTGTDKQAGILKVKSITLAIFDEKF